MRRHKLVYEIYKRAGEIGANKTTIVFLLATMNDKALTKFAQEFLETEKTEKNKDVISLPKVNPDKVKHLTIS